MNIIVSCLYPIFFTGIKSIIYNANEYNNNKLRKYDKFNDPNYNPFIPKFN